MSLIQLRVGYPESRRQKAPRGHCSGGLVFHSLSPVSGSPSRAKPLEQ